MHKFLRSFAYAGSGILYAIRTQLNMRIHVTVALLVILVGAIVSLHFMEWCIVILAISTVLATELINTAIEAVLDRIGADVHPLAKAAKDAAAGAVLVTAVGAAVIGCIIFIPKIVQLLEL